MNVPVSVREKCDETVVFDSGISCITGLTNLFGFVCSMLLQPSASDILQSGT